MAQNLLIVESPAKSKTLKKFLGRNFDVQSTIGHIRDLPKSKLGVDTDDGFKVQYVTIKGKQKVIKKLREAAKKSDTIYLAPDPDREGESIAWHVAQQLKDAKQIARVTFNEITKSAVLNAIENPRQIDLHKVDAQQARRVLDRLVGYKVSPLLWKTIGRGLSAGRVQSVALRIICEREEEIQAFVQEEYWEIRALLEDKDKVQLLAKLVKIDGEKPAIGNEQTAKQIDADLKKTTFVVDEVKRSEKKRKPSPPFITSTLQQDAARALYFSPKKTMMIAQQLYEGVELGDEGPTGLITYMRTDSTRIAETALQSARGYIKKEYGDQYLPEKAVYYKARKGSQDAHEAIRPTYLDHPPDKLKKNLTRDQLRLYTLIWNRFLASQMMPAVYDTTAVIIQADKYRFSANSQSLKFDGFLKLYEETKDNGQNGENGLVDSIPDLKSGDTLKLLEVQPSQHFTKPPARFSQAMLVRTLEADGIGRPSTYASIISTLLDRKYVDLNERRLTPTELGRTVNKILVENFPNLFNVKFTANMETDLDQIESGREEWVTVVRDFYQPFNDNLDAVTSRQQEIKDSITEKTDEVCENCGSPMVIKWGRNGRFLACSAYPECKTTKPLNGENEPMETDEVCEKCGGKMVIREGRFGKFMACSNYPKCKNTKALPTGIVCPRENCGGQISERRTKRGKVFWGCSNYPKCDFASWYKPVNRECPACKNSYLVEKTSKVKGDYLYCPECKNKVYSEEEE